MALALRREPNGRRQRLSRTEDRLVALTAAQPHRRGVKTDAGATGWQRALQAGLVGDQRRNGFTAGELEFAGRSFVEARLAYLKAIEAPIPYAVDSGGKGDDLPKGLRRRWLDDWRKIQAALWRLGQWPYRAVLRATEADPGVDERQWPYDDRMALSAALIALARHFRVRPGA